VQDIERLFRHLTRTLQAVDPARLQQPLSIGELVSRFVPYRTSRRALGVESSEDYELLLLRFASGEGGFANTEPDPVRMRFAKGVRSPNPDLSVLREFRDAVFVLQPIPLARVLSGQTEDDAYAPPPPGTTASAGDDAAVEQMDAGLDVWSRCHSTPRTVPAAGGARRSARRAGGAGVTGGTGCPSGALQFLRRLAADWACRALLSSLRANPAAGPVSALQGGGGVRLASLRQLRRRAQLRRLTPQRGPHDQPRYRLPEWRSHRLRRVRGALKSLSATDLGVVAGTAAIESSGLEAAAIDHVVMGNAQQTSADAIYLARHIGLRSGCRIETPALTVNRLCGSGFEAVVQAAQQIRLGESRAVLAGGTESMSQAPHVVRGARWGLKFGQETQLEDSLWEALRDSWCDTAMAETAENLAREYGIDRAAVDAYALLSQQRARDAWAAVHSLMKSRRSRLPTRRRSSRYRGRATSTCGPTRPARDSRNWRRRSGRTGGDRRQCIGPG
jgi:hypothetical protein